MVDSSKHIEKIFEQKRDFVIIATTGKGTEGVWPFYKILSADYQRYQQKGVDPLTKKIKMEMQKEIL